MERNDSFTMLRMKIEKFRFEKREAFYKDIFSFRKLLSDNSSQTETKIYNLSANNQTEEWVSKMKIRVEELFQCEKQRDIPKLKNLSFLLREELKNNPTPNFSESDFTDINFFGFFKEAVCKSEYLQDEDLSYDLAWSLGIFLSNEKLSFGFLKEQKIIDLIFFTLLKSSMKMQSMCCFMYAQLFLLNYEIRDYCLGLGIADFIATFFLQTQVPGYVFTELIFLSSSIVQKPLPPYEQIREIMLLLSNSIDSFRKYLDDESIKDVLLSLSEIANGPQNQIDDLLALKVHLNAIDLCLKHSITDNIGKFGLRLLGNLITGENGSSEKVVDGGLLLVIDQFTKERNVSDDVWLELCWIVSNMLACGEEIIGKVLKSPVGNYMLKLPMKNTHLTFMKEGAQMVYNIAKIANFSQILQMTEKGLIDLIGFVLDSEDNSTLVEICQAVKKVLKKELEFNSETKITNPLRNEMDKRGIEKKLRELLTYQDTKVFYHAERAINYFEKD